MAASANREETLQEAQARADRAEQQLQELRQTQQSDSQSDAQTSEIGDSRTDRIADLRNDPMMAHLIDALDQGTDIGHYGRLVFAMVASKFLPADQVVGWLTKDRDFTVQQAEVMIRQVENRDYNPPRRERILQWQSEQEFPIIPDTHDPDCGNVYKSLKFPNDVYEDIENYQEEKAREDR
jgi:hypothetical protein